MKKELIRIGTEKFANETTLDKYYAFDLVYGGHYELVYCPDFDPYGFVNGTWRGALGRLVNGTS
jgi:hypothetical protein